MGDEEETPEEAPVVEEPEPEPEVPKTAFEEARDVHMARVQILYMIAGALGIWLFILIICILYIVNQCDTAQELTGVPIITPEPGTYGPGHDDDATCDNTDGCKDNCPDQGIPPQPWRVRAIQDVIHPDPYGNCPGYCGTKGVDAGCTRNNWIPGQAAVDQRGVQVGGTSYCPSLDVKIVAPTGEVDLDGNAVTAVVYYTEDGTIPCVGGIKYTGQILSYSRNTKVRALAVSPNKRQSSRVEHTFRIRGESPCLTCPA